MGIYRVKHQEDRPDAVLTDSRGTVITNGARVAFNYSGAIAIGRLLSFTHRWKAMRQGTGNKMWWHLYVTAKIQHETNDEVARVSTIKNINSFVII